MKWHNAMVWCGVVLCAGVAQGQAVDKWKQLTRVDQDYDLNPTGAYYQVMNRNGKMCNFSVQSGGVWHPIPMADPTVMRLTHTVTGEVWYYCTGTSDAAGAANFMIYRSKDLVNWEPHATAWPDEWRAGSANEQNTLTYPFLTGDPAGTNAITIPGTAGTYDGPGSYAGLWAPQLFWAGGSTVYLAFTGWKKVGNSYPTFTCYLTYTTVGAFEDPLSERSGTRSTVAGAYAMGYFEAPLAWRYRSFGAGAPDGGASLVTNLANTLQDTVPTSGWYDPNATATLGHPSVDLGNGLGTFYGMDSRSWMQLDPFLWYDPQNNGGGAGTDWYVMYTHNSPTWLATTAYRIWRGGPFGWAGTDPSERISQSGVGFIDICRGSTAENSPGVAVQGSSLVVARNGSVGILGSEQTSPSLTTTNGTAEGGSVFRHPTSGRVYTIYSRNSYDSPAYGLFYRVSEPNDTLEEMGLPLSGGSGSGSNFIEYPLVTSAARLRKGGVSFGHGEVFFISHVVGGSTVQTPYLVYHMKEDAVFDGSGNDSYPLIGRSGRTVYFKELRINATTGIIEPITNDFTDPAHCTEVFQVPYSLIGDAPCNSDFNGDGDYATDADIEAFFDCLGG
jgi:hypothetical protein